MKLTDDFEFNVKYDYKTANLELTFAKSKEKINYDEIEHAEDVGNAVMELLSYLEESHEERRKIEREVDAEFELKREKEKEKYIVDKYGKGQE